MSQFSLLRQRRFWPLFWTQFLGAFNDNVFKNALVLFIAYRSVSVLGVSSEMLVVACAGIFILPFFIASGTAGQLADRLPKPMLVRWVKVAEVAIMGLAGVGFATFNVPLLLGVLFLMGTQSAFFGPTKYALLPELLDDRSLVGGNALVEMGTFLAILLGTIAGGLIIAAGDAWIVRVGWIVVAVAAVGLATALALPARPPADPGLRVQWDLARPTWRILRVALRDGRVRMGILGISWFWFMGASFLSILPTYTKDRLGGAETVVTLFLALFCIGIAVGSLLCERLSGGRIELGLVPLGCFGMTVFAADLAWVSIGYATAPDLMQPLQFLRAPGGLRIAVDLFLVAVFSGLYTVPLYTLVQHRARPAERSRVIAGLNIVNSFFMVVSSLVLVALAGAGIDTQWVFAMLAAANLVAAWLLYLQMPASVMRLLAWAVSGVAYRMRVVGGDRFPIDGPAIVVANHVSYIDWLVLAAACPRPPRYIIEARFTRVPVMGRLLRDAEVIPIAGSGREPGAIRRAMEQAGADLADGHLVALFPEGGITTDGRMNRFKPGVERLAEQSGAPVIPVALVGLWGSFFSKRHGKAFTKPFRRGWTPVEVRVGEPFPAGDVTAADLAERVAELGGWKAPPPGGSTAS
jgi:1-acyl-sn-glycerol-3-phosphate acyltransferase